MPIQAELTTQQHIDLLKAYREVAPKCRTQKEAWYKTAHHPAPRYYLDPRQAATMLSKMVKGDFSEVEKMKDTRKRMYYSLFEKLKEMSLRREYSGKSLWFICQFLVAQPAPEFFLGEEAVKRIFIYAKKYGVDFKYSTVRDAKAKKQRSRKKNKS